MKMINTRRRRRRRRRRRGNGDIVELNASLITFNDFRLSPRAVLLFSLSLSPSLSLSLSLSLFHGTCGNIGRGLGPHVVLCDTPNNLRDDHVHKRNLTRGQLKQHYAIGIHITLKEEQKENRQLKKIIKK